MRFPGFIGATYKLDSRRVDDQSCINLYPEKIESGRGREGEAMALRRTPGLLLFLTLPGGKTRGGWKAGDGQMFAVAGNKLYSIAPDATYTELGTLLTSTGRVSMADNGLQLAVVDGTTNLYVWDFGATTFTVYGPDDSFEGASMVVYDDTYLIFSRADRFFISGNNNITLDALDFATSEGSPDAIVGHAVANRQVWVFNETTTEVYYDTGDSNFPFQRIEGAFIGIGCAARFSIGVLGGEVYWIGKDTEGEGIVYKSTGLQPQRISTHAIERAIQKYPTLTDAEAFCYEKDGHGFYQINFPTANATWVYDAATGMWHERAYATNGQLGRHRATWHTYVFGKHLVGDYDSGNVYELTDSAKTDNGNPIIRRRRAPHVSATGNYVTCHSFELDLEVGVGIDGAGQGDDPQVMLRVSKDGGYSWGSERTASLGKIGERLKRARWTRLGQGRDWVFEVSVSDPVEVALAGANIDIETGVA